MEKTESTSIPTTCKECFESPYKLDAPQCPYEMVKELSNTIEYFKKTYKIGLPIDLNAFTKEIQPMAQKCKSQLPSRITIIQKEMERKEQERRTERIENNILDIQKLITSLLQNQNNSNLFKSHEDMKSPIRTVNAQNNQEQQGSENSPGIKIQVEKTKTDNNGKKLVPKGGWKKYQRNVKEVNVKTYLSKLMKAHPELSEEVASVLNGKKSEAVKVSKNSAGNMMIEFRDLVEE